MILVRIKVTGWFFCTRGWFWERSQMERPEMEMLSHLASLSPSLSVPLVFCQGIILPDLRLILNMFLSQVLAGKPGHNICFQSFWQITSSRDSWQTISWKNVENIVSSGHVSASINHYNHKRACVRGSYSIRTYLTPQNKGNKEKNLKNLTCIRTTTLNDLFPYELKISCIWQGLFFFLSLRIYTRDN